MDLDERMRQLWEGHLQALDAAFRAEKEQKKQHEIAKKLDIELAILEGESGMYYCPDCERAVLPKSSRSCPLHWWI